MKETIQAEKTRMQAALDAVTGPGSRMSIFFPDGGTVQILTDSLTVLRVLPQVDAEGGVKEWRYDLMFKEVGYNNGMQYTHLVANTAITQKHNQCAHIKGTDGNEYYINSIEPEIDPDSTKLFKTWIDYKKEHASDFAEIDARLLQEYTRMAERDGK